MEQPGNGSGTRKDLVLYRIQTSKDTLKSAEILFAAEEYKGANNRLIMPSSMPLMQYML